MAKKSTRLELLNRINWVMDAILDGYSNYAIVRHSAENWGVNKRQTEKYMRYANTRIGREAEKDAKVIFNHVRRRLILQYKKAIDKGDGHLARLLTRDIRELYGFDKPTRAILETDLEIRVKLTPADGKEEIGEPKELLNEPNGPWRK